MRVLWIAASAVSRKGGGGTTYADGLQRALALAIPGLELIEAGSPGTRRSFPIRVRRHLASLARSLLSGLPSAALYHRYSHVAAELAGIVRDQSPDIVIFDSAESMIYRDVVPGAGVLVAHNVEGDIIAEQVRALPQPFRGLLEYGFREIEKYRNFERSGALATGAVITISAVDRAVFSEWLPDRPVTQVLPCFGPAAAAGCHRVQRKDAGPVRVVFPAKFSWAPNRQGIEWFIDEIWPAVEPDTELHLFGDGSERYTNPANHIVGHGFVPTVADIWRDADVSIVPTFGGSGLNIKMCEALYHGVPVITTPLAVDRLGFRPTVGLYECANVDAWRQAISGHQLRNIADRKPLRETSICFSDEAAAATWRELLAEFGSSDAVRLHAVGA